jgi:hypothetical protein
MVGRNMAGDAEVNSLRELRAAVKRVHTPRRQQHAKRRQSESDTRAGTERAECRYVAYGISL